METYNWIMASTNEQALNVVIRELKLIIQPGVDFSWVCSIGIANQNYLQL